MSKTNVNLNWKYRIRTFVLFIFWALLTILTGCAGFIRSITPPMIPIQTASVTQIEFYRQWYNFENLNQADRVFRNLVGEKNWELLKAKYIESKDDLLNEIEVQGSIVLKISPVPGDLDCFFMEGIGRYFLINRKNKAIMLSGDYYINQRPGKWCYPFRYQAIHYPFFFRWSVLSGYTDIFQNSHEDHLRRKAYLQHKLSG